MPRGFSQLHRIHGYTGGAEGKGRFASVGMAIGKGLWQGVPPLYHGLAYNPGCMAEVAWRGVGHRRREEVVDGAVPPAVAR